MKKIIGLLLVGLLVLAPYVAAALTKSSVNTTDWTAVAQNAVGESGTIDISDSFSTVLYIEYSLTSATAHTGTKFEVQVSRATSGDEDWVVLTSFTSKTGTPNTEAFGASESAAATVLEVANTTGYVADETIQIYAKDNSIAASELMLLVSHVTDTSVTVQDGITNAHDTSDAMWNIADSTVVELPFAANRVRVIVDNTFDSDGATIDYRLSVTEVTAVS